MSESRVGIIGGTGLGDLIEKSVGGESVMVDTPFGPPSSRPLMSHWEGVDIVFISRHGPGHRLIPSQVPYRANIWALKKLGVRSILASGATGSLREDIEPGHLVLCDQLIDRTTRRIGTFFDDGLVAHVEFAEPFCPRLRSHLATVGSGLSTTVHHAGTYVCMEGPQFSTRAESHTHRLLGGDLIGMTALPEAKLAREAELCYALIALPTDYDCWRPHDPNQVQDDLLQEIMGNMDRASRQANELIRGALRRWSECSESCRCGDALRLAIWSNRDLIDPEVKRRMELLVGRYVG